MTRTMKRFCAATAMLVCGVWLFAQETAYIREFTGTVEVKAPDAAEWTTAVTGRPIGKNTLISTGFRSTAFVALGNSTLVVRPLTRLTLQEIQNIQGDESVNISLQSGRVRAEVKPPENGTTSFVVQSPMVTASVRGTSFDFDGQILRVDEGAVHVSGGDGTGTYVSAGHRSVSDPQTGRTAGGAETFKAGLTPSIPAAGESRGASPTVIIPPGEVDLALELSF